MSQRLHKTNKKLGGGRGGPTLDPPPETLKALIFCLLGQHYFSLPQQKFLYETVQMKNNNKKLRVKFVLSNLFNYSGSAPATLTPRMKREVRVSLARLLSSTEGPAAGD